MNSVGNVSQVLFSSRFLISSITQTDSIRLRIWSSLLDDMLSRTWVDRSHCQGIEGIRAKLIKRGLVLRLGLVIWKAVGLRYAVGIYCREYSTSDRDIRGCSYD